MDIHEFASRHRVRVKRDACKDPIIPGKRFCKDMPARVEYHSHIYEHDAGVLGLCLMFMSARKWESAKRQMAAAGFTIRQDGHTEGTALFDPADAEQAKLAFRLAGIRPRRILSPERLAKLTTARNSRLKSPNLLLNGPSSTTSTTQTENMGSASSERAA